ncbi:MAG: DUF948 domain-containing protein [Parachlamydiaceae bacterium]|nr:MAG: DUF948 domain-containing protein [Parachlamydiaceae bacterium]
MESTLIYEVCTVIATLAFVALAVYIILTLKAFIESLKQINSSLSKLEIQIEPLSNEAIRLLENSNEIAESVQEKLADLDPLMGSISNVGSTLRNVTDSFRHDEPQGRFFQRKKVQLARYSR